MRLLGDFFRVDAALAAYNDLSSTEKSRYA
jgi:hypothetical protein